MHEDWHAGGFGIYIHWPFCEAKCPYCDFNSHVARFIDQTAWRKAYLTELRRAAAETPGRIVQSVFFGGGTPSLVDPATVAAVISEIRALWPMANQPEISLEANPGSVEAGRFADYREAGVNRISMGIQALNDADLKRLGRLHTAAEAMQAFEIARSIFDRVSFDLIYARQHQSLADWESELHQALSLDLDHLSLYQLTIEDGTAFGDRHRCGLLRGLPDEDLGAELFDLTRDLTSAAGLDAYEVSSHAQDGAESKHNLIYWRYGDYIGIGPGAHGRLTLGQTRFATLCVSHPARWLDGVESGTSELPREALTPEEQGREFLLMGLRLAEGVDEGRYRALTGQSLSKSAKVELETLGLIRQENEIITVTNQGVKLLNPVIEALLPG